MNISEITGIFGNGVKTFVTRDKVPEIVNNEKLVGGLLLSSYYGDDNIIPYIIYSNGRAWRLDGSSYQNIINSNRKIDGSLSYISYWANYAKTSYDGSTDILTRINNIVNNATGDITYKSSYINTLVRTAEQTISKLDRIDEDVNNKVRTEVGAQIKQTADKINNTISKNQYVWDERTQTYTLIRKQLTDLWLSYDGLSSYVSDSYNFTTSLIKQTASSLSVEIFNTYSNAISYVTQTADEIKTTVADNDKKIHSELKETAEEIKTSVTDSYNKLNSYIIQTASEIKTTVADNDKKIHSELEETAEEIKTSVTDSYNKLNSYIIQTASEIKTTVADNDKKIHSELKETAGEIKTSVTDSYNKLNSYIIQTANEIKTTVADNDKKIHSELKETAGEIKTSVTDSYNKLNSYIIQTANEIKTTVADNDKKIHSELKETAGEIKTSVTDSYNKLNSYIIQTAREIHESVTGVNNKVGELKITSENTWQGVKGQIETINNNTNTLWTTVTGIQTQLNNINAYADTFTFWGSESTYTDTHFGDTIITAQKIGYISVDDGLVINKGKFYGDVEARSFKAVGDEQENFWTTVSANTFNFYSKDFKNSGLGAKDGRIAYFIAFNDTDADGKILYKMQLIVWDGFKYKQINFDNWNDVSGDTKYVYANTYIVGSHTLYYKDKDNDNTYYTDTHFKNPATFEEYVYDSDSETIVKIQRYHALFQIEHWETGGIKNSGRLDSSKPNIYGIRREVITPETIYDPDDPRELYPIYVYPDPKSIDKDRELSQIDNSYIKIPIKVNRKISCKDGKFVDAHTDDDYYQCYPYKISILHYINYDYRTYKGSTGADFGGGIMGNASELYLLLSSGFNISSSQLYANDYYNNNITLPVDASYYSTIERTIYVSGDPQFRDGFRFMENGNKISGWYKKNKVTNKPITVTWRNGRPYIE